MFTYNKYELIILKMNSTKIKEYNLNKAIEEAIEFGFSKQLILVNGMIKKLVSNNFFLKKNLL